MVFNAQIAGEGSHAVNVMIRDCPNKKCKQPYSKVPLLFLINVEGEKKVCTKPTIIIPPSCNTVPPDQPFEMEIVAEAGDASKPYVFVTFFVIKQTANLKSMFQNSNHLNSQFISLKFEPGIQNDQQLLRFHTFKW